MGLDVYLYHYTDYDKSQQIEQEYEERSEEIYREYAPNYDQMSEEQKNEARERSKQLALEMGLNDWGDDTTFKERIELPSGKYPDHELFKIGYFRSSYNSSGIDRILRSVCHGKTLSWIFGVGDDHHVRPDWQASRLRVEGALEDLHNHSAHLGNVKFERVDFSNTQDAVDSEEQALEVFKKHLQQQDQKTFGSYSCRDGWFFIGEPREVVAIIPGVNSSLGKTEPCAYVAFKSPDLFDFYCTALEIVIETIDYVLAQPNPDEYVLHWSG